MRSQEGFEEVIDDSKTSLGCNLADNQLAMPENNVSSIDSQRPRQDRHGSTGPIFSGVIELTSTGDQGAYTSGEMRLMSSRVQRVSNAENRAAVST